MRFWKQFFLGFCVDSTHGVCWLLFESMTDTLLLQTGYRVQTVPMFLVRLYISEEYSWYFQQLVKGNLKMQLQKHIKQMEISNILYFKIVAIHVCSIHLHRELLFYNGYRVVAEPTAGSVRTTSGTCRGTMGSTGRITVGTVSTGTVSAGIVSTGTTGRVSTGSGSTGFGKCAPVATNPFSSAEQTTTQLTPSTMYEYVPRDTVPRSPAISRCSPISTRVLPSRVSYLRMEITKIIKFFDKITENVNEPILVAAIRIDHALGSYKARFFVAFDYWSCLGGSDQTEQVDDRFHGDWTGKYCIECRRRCLLGRKRSAIDTFAVDDSDFYIKFGTEPSKNIKHGMVISRSCLTYRMDSSLVDRSHQFDFLFCNII